MIFSKMQNLFTAALLVAGSFFLFSCNDEPTPVGYSLVNDTLSFHNLSSEEDGLIVSFESEYKQLFWRNQMAFFIGKAEGVSAASMLRWDKNLPDSLLSFIKPDDIQSIKLKLTPNRYVLGDSNNTQQNITVYQVNKWWELGIRWDSIFTASQPVDYVDPNPITTQELNIPLQDSMHRITIDLTNDRFKQDYITWLEENDRDTTKTLTNFGLLLVPEDNSNHINSFKTQITEDTEEAIPELELIYNHKDGRLDTILTKATMDGYLTNLEERDEGKISISANTGLTSILSIDVSAIPKRAAIHKSYLEFTLDRENSVIGNFPKDSILAAKFIMNGEHTEPNPIAADSNGVYRIEYMQHAIEYFKSKDGLGEIEISIYSVADAGKKLDRLRFYGMDAEDPEKRPKFNIVYSMIVEKGEK